MAQPVPKPAEAATWWDRHAVEFRKYHSKPMNVGLHLLTTPLALSACVAVAVHLAGRPATAALVLLWTVSLGFVAPVRIFAGTMLIHAVAFAGGAYLAGRSLPALALIFAVGYFGQDFAHWATSEPTYQSSYAGGSTGNFLAMLAQHTYLLIPLVLDACGNLRPGSSLADLVAQNNMVVFRSLLPTAQEPIDAMRKWVVEQDLREDITTHWWRTTEDRPGLALPDEQGKVFDEIALHPEVYRMFDEKYPEHTWAVEPVHAMNEVYVSAMKKDSNAPKSSDSVFWLDHVDGPFGWLPFGRVHRCILGLTPNTMIETVFPMNNEQTRWTVSTGDLVGFDFNREVHRIQYRAEGRPNAEPRIVLKLHYVVYPKHFRFFGKLIADLTSRWDTLGRTLFLATIEPNSLRARIGAMQVVVGTNAWVSIEKYVGFSTIQYLFLLALLSLALGSYLPFLIGTSFAHYFVYMATYSLRGPGADKRVAFYTFKRDAVFLKSLALAQAFFLFYQRFDFEKPDVLALAIMVLGFGLSSWAAKALGFNLTYFGWELGVCKGEFVQQLPYGMIPHPMILGSCMAWAGFHKLAAFRSDFPWYVPMHIAFYAMHATQEHLAIHSSGVLAQSDGKKCE